MAHEFVNPLPLGAPRGYSNGVLAGPGQILFIAGQIGWDEQQRLASDDFALQFDRALQNVLAVVRGAGGSPEHLCRLTIYVTDKQQYLARLSELGASYRRRMGRHYPTMTLVEVRALLEPDATVEIEATAVIPVAKDRT